MKDTQQAITLAISTLNKMLFRYYEVAHPEMIPLKATDSITYSEGLDRFCQVDPVAIKIEAAREHLNSAWSLLKRSQQ